MIMQQRPVARGGIQQGKVARTMIAAVAFALLTALWVALWIPSAPIP
jgi:hypothetical protein